MTGRGAVGYTFGDDEGAAARLDVLADVYAGTSRAFLAGHGPKSPDVALDLGCGPGNTTAMVAGALGAQRTIGLDSSEAFLERARHAYPQLEFQRHEVTDLPLPVPPADVIYARFLLAHLADPLRQAVAWAGALRPGGRLLLEESERMHADDPACARYLELVVATFTADGKTLFAGEPLAGLADGDDWVVRHSAAVELREPAWRFAELFVPNLAHWGPRAVAHGLATAAEIDELGQDLRQTLEEGRAARDERALDGRTPDERARVGLAGHGRAEDRSPGGSVTAVLRQVVVERGG